MAFEPFGYRFEVFSPLTPEEVKAAIRTRKTGFYDRKSGARGWIIGPFVCLWFRAFDRYGPMLFGQFSSDGLGTRIHGRAGSDLNGMVLYAALVPLLAWLAYMAATEDQLTTLTAAIIAILLVVGAPLTFYWSHKDRKNAEPLVRFIRNALGGNPADRERVGTLPARGDPTLIVNGVALNDPVTRNTAHEAFLRVGDGDFLIKEVAPEIYLQTACRGEGYLLEKREGDPGSHSKAMRAGSFDSKPNKPDYDLTHEEVIAAIAAYVEDRAMPSFLRWDRIDEHGQ